MMKPWLVLSVCMVLLLPAPSAFCQEAPAGADKAAGADEALAWDRDFDLLLELKNTPTKTQRAAENERAALLKERDGLASKVAELKARLAAVEGTYTTEALLTEMLRQDVADMQSVRDNLRRWIKADEDRMSDIDARLKAIAPPGAR